MRATGEDEAGDWFEQPLGLRVLHEERALAPIALEDVFGFELLQIGSFGPGTPWLEHARTQHTTLVAPAPGAGVGLCAPLTHLPFAADSIDAVLLPHTLERVADPHAVLREAGRVLSGEGCLLIGGFNPWSGWGARRLAGRALRRPAFPPCTRRLLSERRLRDWVALLDFEVERVHGYLGTLPLAGRPPREAGHRPRRPLTAGAYLLKARKRVATLTALKPRRSARQRVLRPAAEPVPKVSTPDAPRS